MKNKTYLEINSKQECKLVQEYLFAMGYKWAGRKNEVPEIINNKAEYLVIYNDTKIIKFTDREGQRIAIRKGLKLIKGYTYISPLWKVLNG